MSLDPYSEPVSLDDANLSDEDDFPNDNSDQPEADKVFTTNDDNEGDEIDQQKGRNRHWTQSYLLPVTAKGEANGCRWHWVDNGHTRNIRIHHPSVSSCHSKKANGQQIDSVAINAYILYHKTHEYLPSRQILDRATFMREVTLILVDEHSQLWPARRHVYEETPQFGEAAELTQPTGCCDIRKEESRGKIAKKATQMYSMFGNVETIKISWLYALFAPTKFIKSNIIFYRTFQVE